MRRICARSSWSRRSRWRRCLSVNAMCSPSPVTPNENGSAVELGEPKTNDVAILHDPVEIVTGTVAWRPERAETAFTVHRPLPMRTLFVVDVCGGTTGFERLSGAVGIDKASCCHGGCDVLCPHGIGVSNSEVLERLDHFLLRGFSGRRKGLGRMQASGRARVAGKRGVPGASVSR